MFLFGILTLITAHDFLMVPKMFKTFRYIFRGFNIQYYQGFMADIYANTPFDTQILTSALWNLNLLNTTVICQLLDAATENSSEKRFCQF